MGNINPIPLKEFITEKTEPIPQLHVVAIVLLVIVVAIGVGIGLAELVAFLY